MNFDFAKYLTYAVLLTGIVVLIDRFLWLKKRKLNGKKEPLVVEYCRAFFPVLFIVWGIRSFIVQPYRVPTGSLEPTIVPGDFIAVNQFAYGLRMPVVNKTFVPIGEPKRGDIALFRWPVNPKIVFVKRVVGLPGDHVVYKDKILYVNGKEATQKAIGDSFDVDPSSGVSQPVQVKQENLLGIVHKIFVHAQGGETQNIDVTVPKGHYFMMGDNRDNSDDSRMWGFVPENNLIGKAFGVWMSWNSVDHSVRWKRIGHGIH